MPYALLVCIGLGALGSAPTHEGWLSYDWRAHNMPVTKRGVRPLPEQLVHSAEKYLGVPYSWGGTGRSGFDCSGFINKIYAENGYDLPRVSREQVHVGLSVDRRALQTADLLFFDASPGRRGITHVGMYLHDDTFIHASEGKGEVAFDRLTEAYFSERLIAARRVLVLPPGRYSTAQGGAASGVEFAKLAQAEDYLVNANDAPSPMDPYSAKSARDEAAPGAQELLSEHDPNERPPQFAPAYNRGGIAEVGPALLTDDATRVGLRFGGSRMDNEGSLLIIPEFQYFGHESAFDLDLAFPLQARTDGSETFGETFDRSWSTVRDFGRVLRGASFGQKEANVYVSLERTTSQTLGDGQVMRYFTPNVASRTLPAYLFVPNALSLSFDLNFDAGGGSVFLDDLFVPRIFGASTYLRPAALFNSDDPLMQALSLSLTYSADFAAPETLAATNTPTSSVHAAGVTLDASLFRNQTHDVKAFADVSMLARASGVGVGGALGVAWHGMFGETRQHAVRLRLEGRLGSAGYLPSYFDLSYALDRNATAVSGTGGNVMPKLAWLDVLSDQSGRVGFYSEAMYQLHRRATLGIAYEDGRAFGYAPPALQYPSRSLMFFAQLRNIYLGGEGRALHMHVAYDLRHFEELSPMFSSTRGNEYVFATLTLDMTSAVEINGTIRKALDVANLQSAAIDMGFDVTFHYEL